jgi:hypothetical protein
MHACSHGKINDDEYILQRKQHNYAFHQKVVAAVLKH